MSHPKEAKGVGNLEFRWGKKQTRDSTEDFQYYESFTYDGVEYHLYDSVYIWHAGELEPYIGKLIKMWEVENHKKLVKVVWFLRPNEIQCYLRGLTPDTKEIFLACGRGKGLTNINSLEAISGKCHVVCTSEDRRNPQASSDDLRVADHIFWRTFNVGNCSISEKFPNDIAAVEVEYFFNKRKNHKFIHLPKLEGNLNKRSQQSTLSSEFEANATDLKAVKDGHPWSKHQDKKEAKIPAPCLGKQAYSPSKSAMMSGATKISGKQVGDKAKGRYPQESGSDARLPKKRKLQDILGIGGLKEDTVNVSKQLSSAIVPKSASTKVVEKNESTTGVNSNVKPCTAPELRDDHVRKPNGKPDQFQPSCGVESKSLSAKCASVNKVSTKGVNVDPKPGNIPEQHDGQLEKRKGELAHIEQACAVKQNLWSTKYDICEKRRSTKSGDFNMKSCRTPEEGNGQIENCKSVTDPQVISTKRPVMDSSNWFKQLSWEEQIEKAHGAGSLVLLDNLNPSYSSSEVEGVVRGAFNKNVSANMIQHRTFSSPRYGQALVLFKSKDDADFALSELNRKCLIVGGRPVVGRRVSIVEPGNSSTFVGHLTIEKLKFQKQNSDWRKAMSTSHCSQPNTIEFEMAMEWCVLQERARISRDALHEQQSREIADLKKQRGPLHKHISVGAAKR